MFRDEVLPCVYLVVTSLNNKFTNKNLQYDRRQVIKKNS